MKRAVQHLCGPRRRSRGVAAVEFALVIIPLLVLALIGFAAATSGCGDEPTAEAKEGEPLELGDLESVAAAKDVNVDMIVQNVSREGSTDLSFTVVKSDLPATLRVTRSVSHRIGAGEVTTDEGVAKLSIVGIGMRSHSGIAAKMFDAMARERINIEMISTSEIKISCVIRKAHAERAVRVLHRAFGLSRATISGKKLLASAKR